MKTEKEIKVSHVFIIILGYAHVNVYNKINTRKGELLFLH